MRDADSSLLRMTGTSLKAASFSRQRCVRAVSPANSTLNNSLGTTLVTALLLYTVYLRAMRPAYSSLLCLIGTSLMGAILPLGTMSATYSSLHDFASTSLDATFLPLQLHFCRRMCDTGTSRLGLFGTPLIAAFFPRHLCHLSTVCNTESSFPLGKLLTVLEGASFIRDIGAMCDTHSSLLGLFRTSTNKTTSLDLCTMRNTHPPLNGTVGTSTVEGAQFTCLRGAVSDAYSSLDNLIGTPTWKATLFPLFLGTMCNTYTSLLGMVRAWRPPLADEGACINVFLRAMRETISTLVGLVDASSVEGASLRRSAVRDTYATLNGLISTPALEVTNTFGIFLIRRFPLRGGRAPFFDSGHRLLRLFLPSVVLRHLFLYLYDGRR